MAEVNKGDEVGTTLARVVRDNLNLPLSDGDIQSILGEVRANHALLEGCPRHDFQQIEPGKFGTKYKCAACGGVVDGINANWYKSGLEHAKGGQDTSANSIRIWHFQDAPEQFRKLSRHAGDEDWVVYGTLDALNAYLPGGLENVIHGDEWSYLNGWGHVDRHDLEIGVLVIFAHA